MKIFFEHVHVIETVSKMFRFFSSSQPRGKQVKNVLLLFENDFLAAIPINYTFLPFLFSSNNNLVRDTKLRKSLPARRHGNILEEELSNVTLELANVTLELSSSSFFWQFYRHRQIQYNNPPVTHQLQLLAIMLQLFWLKSV